MSELNSHTTQLDLSVVVPLFNEAQSLQELCKQIIFALKDKYHFEIIFVDDGSTDSSWKQIEALAKKDERVKGITFRKNYGKSTALQAGFDEAKGSYVATMDADLQDDPAELPAMLAMLDEGCDLVSGWKKQRQDPLSKTIPSRFFNKVTAKIAGISLNDFNCGLKVYKKEVVNSITLHGELHRYIPLLAKWQGYNKIGEKVVKHRKRKHGKTKFGLSRFMHGFLDLLTLVFVSKYEQRPMHFFGTLGFLFLAVGGVINLYLTIDKLFFGASLDDRPMLLFGVMLMVLGAQFFSIGFLGDLIFRHRNNQNKPNIKEKI